MGCAPKKGRSRPVSGVFGWEILFRMHPTQIFLHNASALRVEYRLDDQRLLLWWSPRAGESYDCADRNYSHRDNPLEVFQEITLPEFGLRGFAGCDYDPYHCVLRYETGAALHLAVAPDAPVLCVWAERAFVADFKTARHDGALAADARRFAVTHAEPRYTFVFEGRLGAGAGEWAHACVHAPENSRYARARPAAGQVLAIGAGIDAAALDAALAAALARGVEGQLAHIERVLAPVERAGRVEAPGEPELMALRRTSVRALHSMVDASGAFRASLKAIYYLIWVRDAGFAFGYHAAAGWTHRLEEVIRCLLANPTTAVGAGVPAGRFFGQLVNRTYGKYEEDGVYYVTWLLHTHWTQTGSRALLDGAGGLALAREALDWVERRTWDEAEGLFGNYFADETPAVGSRDHGHDNAIGMPAGDEGGMRLDEAPVARSYDVYFNVLLHSTYAMLAEMGGDAGLAAKAERLGARLAPLLRPAPGETLPDHGRYRLADGTWRRVGPWGPDYATSTYVWALALPNFLVVPGQDALRARLLEAIIAAPKLHFLNGVNAAVAAIDPWVYPEEKLLAIHRAIAAQAEKPGKYLPMGGAMPEKFDAPEGNLYHDIRPQGFAMGSWLAAWAGLAVRRLPHGLALRPSAAIRRVEAYPWRGYELDLRIETSSRAAALRVGDRRVPGTLQIPQEALAAAVPVGAASVVVVALVEGGAQDRGPLWLRSTVELLSVSVSGGAEGGVTAYRLRAHGPSEIVFAAERGAPARLRDAETGREIFVAWGDEAGLRIARFAHRGEAVLGAD